MLSLLPFAAALAGGLREPWAWAAFSCAFWAWAALRPAPDLKPWWPWLGALALSAGVSAQPYLALAPLSRWALAVAFWGLCSERRHWTRGLLLTGAAVCLLALAGSWTLRGVYNPRDLGEVTTGLFSSYYNYTAFVGAAAAAQGLTVWPLGLLPLLSFGAFAWTTKPRAALLGLLAAGCALALRRGWWQPVALAALLGVGVVYLKRDRAAVAKRPQLWRAALQVAKDKPLLGEGPGNYEAGFRRHNFASDYRHTRYQFSTAYAHSEPLQVLAETGLAGFAALAFALWSCLGFSAALVAMSTQLLADNMLHVPAFLLLYMSALAPPKPAGRPWKGWPLFCAAGAALALAAWLLPPRLPAEPGGWEAKARAAAAAGDAEGADKALSAAQELSPFNALYPAMRAELARARGDWPAAEKLAAKAAELEPNFLQPRLVLAEGAARRGDKAEARAWLAEVKARTLPPQPDSELTDYDRMILEYDAQRASFVEKLVQSR